MMCSPQLRRRRLKQMDSIIGRMNATSANRIPSRSATFRKTCRVRRISITTALGVRTAPTGLSGIPRKWDPTGLLTAMAIGATLLPGAGLGLTILPGALLRFTMAAGATSAAGGAGTQVRDLAYLSTVRRSSDFSAEASALDSAQILASAGSRSALANRSIPGTTRDTGIGTGSTFAIQ